MQPKKRVIDIAAHNAAKTFSPLSIVTVLLLTSTPLIVGVWLFFQRKEIRVLGKIERQYPTLS